MPPAESRRRLWLLGAAATAVGAVFLVKLLPDRAQPRPAPAPDAPATPPAREPAQPSPAPPPGVPAVPSPAPSQGPDDRGEANTMARIRAAVGPRPDEALALIDSLDREHRGARGPLAQERAALKVDALVAAQRIGIARDAAEEFMRQYPHSPRIAHLEALTGVHPHPPELDE